MGYSKKAIACSSFFKVEVSYRLKVSIIIVNWNGKAHLQTCLDSINVQTFRDFETILVDNGSVDGSLEFVANCYPWVKTVPRTVNHGFAEANNIGFLQASGLYIVTLNNDTLVAPSWLDELVRVADENPRVGMVASRICSYNDHDIIDSLGIHVCRDGMSRGAYRLLSFSKLVIHGTENILLPSACSALYRKEMIDDIGFFDEDFFAYCEDTDIGIRARLAGWGALLASKSVVYHKYSQTSGSFSPLKLYLVERNHYWVVLKNFPLRYVFLLPFITLCRFIYQLRIVLLRDGAGYQFAVSNDKGAYFLALFRGMVDAFKMSPKMIKKRLIFQSKIKLSSRAMARLLRAHRLSFKELLDAG